MCCVNGSNHSKKLVLFIGYFLTNDSRKWTLKRFISRVCFFAFLSQFQVKKRYTNYGDYKLPTGFLRKQTQYSYFGIFLNRAYWLPDVFTHIHKIEVLWFGLNTYQMTNKCSGHTEKMSRKLNFDLKMLSNRNRDGSIATQSNRQRILEQMANQLHEQGYRNMRSDSLKEKHVNSLVTRWQKEELSSGTIKNRMAALRWWSEKIGKQNIISRDNSVYGIADRQFVSDNNKAQQLNQDRLAMIKDPYLRVSIELQREFGLRREESMKFKPSYADQGNFIQLKPSWTKGGRAREIPIRTDSQRDVLDRAHKLAGNGSLIPPHLKYVQQLRLYEKHTVKVGFSKLHGLRHMYAQRRYQEMTGKLAPIAGGTKSRDLSSIEKMKDQAARMVITRELGHGREQITAVYLGR